MIDSVILRDRDAEVIPAEKVIRLHGHPATDSDPNPGVSIEVCDYDETTTEQTLTVLATFYVDATELRAALTLVLGETPTPERSAP